MRSDTSPAEILNACNKIVEMATKTCNAPTVSMPAPSSATANFDALAASYASLASAFTWGTIILAVFALIFAVSWGFVVRKWAEHEAQKVAKDCADSYIQRWLTDEAPVIIRSHVDLLRDATIGNGDDDKAADQIGEHAG